MASDTATVLRNVEGLFAGGHDLRADRWRVAGTVCVEPRGGRRGRPGGLRGPRRPPWKHGAADLSADPGRGSGGGGRGPGHVPGAGTPGSDHPPQGLGRGLAARRRGPDRLQGDGGPPSAGGRGKSRGGEMAAARSIEQARRDSDPDRWAELHEELTVLPETFRLPLVLCYLEGLTQEQAAARLRCPLGTDPEPAGSRPVEAQGAADPARHRAGRGLSSAPTSQPPVRPPRRPGSRGRSRTAVEFSNQRSTFPGLGGRSLRSRPTRHRVPCARWGSPGLKAALAGDPVRGRRHDRQS